MTTTKPGDTTGRALAKSDGFHPYEIGIVGPEGSFRDDLAVALARAMAPEFHLGVLPHSFPPSDAAQPLHVARFLTTPEQHVVAMPRDHASDAMRLPLLDLDAVFVQAELTSPLPKIMVVGDGLPPKADAVFAYAAEERACPVLPPSAPFYASDEIEALGDRVGAQLSAQAAVTPVCGLVLAGGKSVRMGTDKSLLEYHGKPQVLHCHDMLAEVCDEVRVSVAEEAGVPDAMQGLSLLPDRFLGYGPIGGVLTALSAQPDSAWLVLACDLPSVSLKLLNSLLAERNPFAYATSFLAEDGLPEPLCTVYEPKSRFLLHRELSQGNESLRGVLRGSRCAFLRPPDPASLTNVNSKEDHDRRVAALANQEREDA